MSILTITSGLYSNAEPTVKQLSKELNARVATDADILEKVQKAYDIKPAILRKVIESKPIAFNDFTHEKEKCLAFMKTIIAGIAAQGDCIFHGILGHLIPKEISHVMRVLIITDKKNRAANGQTISGLPPKKVEKNMEESDKTAFLWTGALFNKQAWDESLYDIVIPSDKMDAAESAALITAHIEKLLSNKEELIKKEISDFNLIADVDVVLSEVGQGLFAECDAGHVTVTIDKKVMMLTKFQQKIMAAVETVPGVRSVKTKIGKNYYKGDIIHNFEFETPLRILLVDDEKEFVHTLSERLKMRRFSSEIAYNGQEALDFADQEDTEVMVLDLKMPGIDGLEVLRKIKETKPEIEVIILTGHGTEKDRKICMDLGAFAYLQKPADIDLITETMKKAYEKIAARRQ